MGGFGLSFGNENLGLETRHPDGADTQRNRPARRKKSGLVEVVDSVGRTSVAPLHFDIFPSVGYVAASNIDELDSTNKICLSAERAIYGTTSVGDPTV